MTQSPQTRDPIARRLLGAAPAVVALLALGLATITPYLSTAIDDAMYTLLARSLAERGAYVNLGLVGTPAHAHWPPGFPLLLCPLVTLWPNSLVVLKLAVLGASLGFAAVAGAVADPREPGRRRVVALLVATNPAVVALAANVESELPHALLVLAYLAWLRKALDRGPVGSWPSLGLCVLLVAAYFVRPITVVAFAATLIVAGLRREWKLLVVVGIGFSLPVATWQVRCWRVAQRAGSVDEEHFTMYLRGVFRPREAGSRAAGRRTAAPAAIVGRRALRHLGAYAEAATASVAGPWGVSVMGSDTYSYFQMAGFWGRGGRKTGGWRACVWGIGLAILAGWAATLRRRRSPHEIYFALQIIVLLLFTVQDNRQIVGLTPFVYNYLLAALAFVGKPLRRRAPNLCRSARAAAVAVLLLLSLLVAITHAGLCRRGVWKSDAATDDGLAAIYPDDWAARFIAARWLRAHRQPGAVVMCQRGIAEALHMECGLAMTPLPRTRDSQRLVKEATRLADDVVGAVGMPAIDSLLAAITAGRAPKLDVVRRVQVEGAKVVVIHNRKGRLRGEN